MPLEEPFEDVVYDDPQSGRPAELSEQEHDQFEEREEALRERFQDAMS